MSKTAEVIVVGGGLEGASAAWALTQRGIRDVVVFERSTVGSGATGKSSGIVRCHYGVRSLAAMAWKGTQLYEQAGDVFGEDIGFRQSGYIVGVGPENVSALAANLAMQRTLGIDVEDIGHEQVAQLWPTARLDDFAAFAYEPRGGYGDAHRTAQAFAHAARRGGAVIRQQSGVRDLLVSRDRVVGVRLVDGEQVHASTVVIAAGPWSLPLLEPHAVRLPITVHRETIVLISPGRELVAAPVLSDLVSLQYVRSEGRELLFGNSDLATLEPADPDRYTNGATADFLERAVDKLAHRFPGLPDAAISSTYAGCYDVTPDFNPIISTVDVAGLVVAAGFSGHGFKIAPAVGQLVADLVCDAASSDPDVPEHDFRLARFTEGTPLSSPHPYQGAGQLR